MPVAIALDTSSRRTGYVRGKTDGSGPLKIDSFGLIREDKNDIGAGMIEFREALRPRLTGVDIIFMEKPALPFGKLNYDTLRILYGIAGMVEVMAIDMKIPCFDVDNGKHKKLIYGKGGAKPENTEAMMNLMPRGFGFMASSNFILKNFCIGRRLRPTIR